MTRHDHYVWQTFLSAEQTLASTRRNYPEWHQGRSRFCVWGILLEQDAVITELARARQWLNPYLVQPYQRQAHITLTPCGFWLPDPTCVSTEQQDNYSETLLTEQLCRLEQLNPRSFELQIGALSSFSSASYLEVGGETDGLIALRQCLPGFFEDIRESAYVPHVTVGCYREAFSVATIAAHIDEYPLLPAALRVQVREIALLSYAADDIGSPLKTERRYRLAD